MSYEAKIVKMNEEKEFSQRKTLANRYGETLSESAARKLLDELATMLKRPQFDVHAFIKNLEMFKGRFFDRYAPEKKPETCKGCKHFSTEEYKSVSGDYGMGNNVKTGFDTCCSHDEQKVRINSFKDEQYVTAKRTMVAYEKDSAKQKIKSCKHQNTFQGSMPNSQSVHYYIQCRDCGYELQEWVEPA